MALHNITKFFIVRWERAEGNFVWFLIEKYGGPSMIAFLISIVNWFTQAVWWKAALIFVGILLLGMAGVVFLNKLPKTDSSKTWVRYLTRSIAICVAMISIMIVVKHFTAGTVTASLSPAPPLTNTASVASNFTIQQTTLASNAVVAGRDAIQGSTVQVVSGGSNVIVGRDLIHAAPSNSLSMTINGANNGAQIGTMAGGIVNIGLNTEDVRQMLREEMHRQEAEKGPEFTNEFKLGYTLFSMSSAAREIVPFSPMRGAPNLTVVWTNAFTETTRSNITIHLPDIYSGFMKFKGQSVALPRVNGASTTIDFPAYTGINYVNNTFVQEDADREHRYSINSHTPTYSITTKIVEIQKDITVAVVGLNPVKPWIEIKVATLGLVTNGPITGVLRMKLTNLGGTTRLREWKLITRLTNGSVLVSEADTNPVSLTLFTSQQNLELWEYSYTNYLPFVCAQGPIFTGSNIDGWCEFRFSNLATSESLMGGLPFLIFKDDQDRWITNRFTRIKSE